MMMLMTYQRTNNDVEEDGTGMTLQFKIEQYIDFVFHVNNL